jgi:hypothetical protein
MLISGGFGKVFGKITSKVSHILDTLDVCGIGVLPICIDPIIKGFSDFPFIKFARSVTEPGVI